MWDDKSNCHLFRGSAFEVRVYPRLGPRLSKTVLLLVFCCEFSLYTAKASKKFFSLFFVVSGKTGSLHRAVLESFATLAVWKDLEQLGTVDPTPSSLRSY